jgi:hypothetical protein
MDDCKYRTKECAQSRLPFLATNEPDSRRIILVISVTSEKQDYTPHLNPLPAKRSEAEESVHAGVLQLACAMIGS